MVDICDVRDTNDNNNICEKIKKNEQKQVYSEQTEPYQIDMDNCNRKNQEKIIVNSKSPMYNNCHKCNMDVSVEECKCEFDCYETKDENYIPTMDVSSVRVCMCMSAKPHINGKLQCKKFVGRRVKDNKLITYGIDTQCTVSVASIKTLPNYEPLDNAVKLKAANGTYLRVVGKGSLRLAIGYQKTIICECLVTPDISDDLLIGECFATSYLCT
jgi:hypothetical protein